MEGRREIDTVGGVAEAIERRVHSGLGEGAGDAEPNATGETGHDGGVCDEFGAPCAHFTHVHTILGSLTRKGMVVAFDPGFCMTVSFRLSWRIGRRQCGMVRHARSFL